MDEARQVRAFQRTGDPAVFRTLVERHRGNVFRTILARLGPARAAEAEELAQEVFVTAYRKLAEFRGASKLSTWLYRVAANLAIDHRSRLAFRAEHQPAETLEGVASERPDADPHRSAVDSRRRSLVRECVAELADPHRSVLHLHYWMGMTVPEIARELSMPEGTVKSHLHRARGKLQKALAARGVTHA